MFLRWVKAIRNGLMEIVVDTNNGVERQNKDFKYECLRQFKDNALSGMWDAYCSDWAVFTRQI